MVKCPEYSSDYFTINRNRLLIYELLLLLFGHPPEKSTLVALRSSESLKTLAEFSEGAKLIYTAIDESKGGEDVQVIKELKEEYTRLFLGPNFLPAPLWESVYLGKEHIMFEEETLQVREAYEEFGLEFVRLNKEPEDHLVIELEFIMRLIEKSLGLHTNCEREELLTYLDGQIRFLNNHLLKWSPQFCELLLKATECRLYQGAAILLAEFLPCDLEVATNLREVLIDE